MSRRILVSFPRSAPRYKKSKELCSTAYCRRTAARGKSICSKHHSIWYKNTHPLKYHFNLLRCTAKRRGKEFTLTFEKYRQLAEESDLQNHRGKTAASFSVDRKDSSKGYTDDNVRICTMGENSSKGCRGEWNQWLSKTLEDATNHEDDPVAADNCPF